MRGDWITWELAEDRYMVSAFSLEMLGCVYPNLCDSNKCLVRDFFKEVATADDNHTKRIRND